MDRKDTKNLKRRYLIWFYKSVKEEMDRVERKFTQVEVDSVIIKELKRIDKAGQAGIFIKQFEEYVVKKKKDGLDLKFEKSNLKPDYVFIAAKLRAVEKAIIKELGKKGLREIKLLYEKEMIERILRSTEH